MSKKSLKKAFLLLAALPVAFGLLFIQASGAVDLEKAAADQIKAAKEAIAKAKKAEAEKFASDALKEAEELLDEAQELFNEGDYERAEVVALSAEIQAERAMEMAALAKERGEESDEEMLMMSKTSPSPSAPPPPSPSPRPRKMAKKPMVTIGGGAIMGSVPPPSSAYQPAHGGTRPPNNAAYDAMFFETHGVNPFIDAEDDHLSTFAVDVDTGSYTICRKYIFDGNLPPKEAVRVEEFVNYFKYDYKKPDAEAFSVNLEGGPSNFGGARHEMLRVGIQGKEVKPEDRKSASLVFVIDVSGSMDRENRLGLVKKTLRVLVDQLEKGDEVGIVIYGSRAEVVLEPTGIKDKQKIIDAIEKLGPGGATNAEAGIYLAYQMAAESFKPGGINRVILCSDGVANVGETGADEILKRIERYADKGVTLTTVGFGMGNYNDVMMEKLADKGDGQYAYVDNLSEARRVFVENLTGTLQVIAKDVKVQVDFNPEVVQSYRLLGYENRDVADEDFRNDKVDAGEIGSGHQVTALYEIKFHKDGKPGKVADVYIRYKSPDREERVKEVKRGIEKSEFKSDFEKTDADLRLAASVAEFSEILRKSYWAKDGKLEDVMAALQGLPAERRSSADVIELIDLVSKAKKIQEANPE